MYRKLLALTMITIVSLTSLNGCGKNSDLQSKYDELQADYDSLLLAYDELNVLCNGMQSEKLPSASISITGDGTGRYSFNSVDSKIIFKSELGYPDAIKTSANGYLNIVENVSVKLTSNWIAKTSGATLELEHMSGISGTIKVGECKDEYDSKMIQNDVLGQWLLDIPASDVAYSTITIDGLSNGCQAVTDTVIDDEDAQLKCGMFAYEGYSVTYVFVYRGSKDINKDESIATLLNSIKILDEECIIEQ